METDDQDSNNLSVNVQDAEEALFITKFVKEVYSKEKTISMSLGDKTFGLFFTEYHFGINYSHNGNKANLSTVIKHINNIIYQNKPKPEDQDEDQEEEEEE